MSSFAINGRLLFDPDQGAAALAPHVDPRLYVFELVAALAVELRRCGVEITSLEIE